MSPNGAASADRAYIHPANKAALCVVHGRPKPAGPGKITMKLKHNIEATVGGHGNVAPPEKARQKCGDKQHGGINSINGEKLIDDDK